MILQLHQNGGSDEEQELNFLSEEVCPKLHDLRDGQRMGKQGHHPLYQVEVVEEANASEMLEQGRDMEGHQASRQQRCISEVKIVSLFFDEGPQVRHIDLLEQGHDEALFCRALQRSEENDSDRVQTLDVRAVFVYG